MRKYVKIYNDMMDGELTLAELYVYGYIEIFGSKGYYGGVSTMATECRMNVRAVKYALSHLKAGGWLEVVKGDRNRSIYIAVSSANLCTTTSSAISCTNVVQNPAPM